jgi:hypothetical protein
VKAIWKFPLQKADLQRVEMPESAEVLTVQVQGDQICLWAYVDPTDRKRARFFDVVPTGSELPDDFLYSHRYVGTFQLQGGALVFHVFESKQR